MRSSAVPVVAADDTNRIIAVSPSVAELLGYEVDELVGERVTTIIPPRLRELYVAGFTRYLATGKVTLLGRRLQLPARHRDGTEIERMWRFEARPPRAAGRCTWPGSRREPYGSGPAGPG